VEPSFTIKTSHSSATFGLLKMKKLSILSVHFLNLRSLILVLLGP